MTGDCWHCGEPRGGYHGDDCWHCGTRGAYSDDTYRDLFARYDRYPGFFAHMLNPDGSYKQAYCAEHGRPRNLCIVCR